MSEAFQIFLVKLAGCRMYSSSNVYVCVGTVRADLANFLD